jgi:hypothetical protein
MTLNKWHKQISTKIDKSCLHRGWQFVEWVGHRFSAAHWLNKCRAMHLTSIGDSLPIEVTLALENIFWCWNAFDQPLNKSMKSLSVFSFSWGVILWGSYGVNEMTWFTNSIQWHEKTHQLVWDSLLDYGRVEWQGTLQDLGKKTLKIAYNDVLEKSDRVWCLKGFIVTCSNLVFTWKARPWMGIISWPPWFVGFLKVVVIFFFAQKNKKT